MTTIDCKDIKVLLSGLVDGEIDTETRHHAERHLADCKSCRDVLNEAERVSEVLALDAQRQLWPIGLPAGFEDAVLKRTVYADAYQFAGRRWTSWLGWVAAAASLLLATSIWVLDRQSGTPVARVDGRENTSSTNTRSTSFYKPDAYAQSRVWEGGSIHHSNDSDVSLAPATLNAVDAQLIQYQPAPIAQTINAIQHSPAISEVDADTLFAVSNVIDLLQRSDVGNFSDVDRIRRIAEYDDLLGRMSQARQRLSADDRPAVLAAESMLLRIVRGPVSQDDLKLMRDTAISMNLASQLAAMGNPYESASSL